VVADAVAFERVSASIFPASRENNREFRQIRLLCETLKANKQADSKAFGRIPYTTEQGFALPEQGISTQEQGIFIR
jgi:hypothetical protein